MGCKGKKAKGRDGETEVEQPALQLTTKKSFNPKGEDPSAVVDMCVAALQDKRSATREKGLAVLDAALLRLVPQDELDSRCFTILELCRVLIKKGSANTKEARLAYRVVGLVALTLHDGAARPLAEAFPMLSRTIQVQASRDDEPTLVAALNCVALVTFAGALHPDEEEQLLKAIWAVIFKSATETSGAANTTKTTSQVLVAAVTAWTILVTTIDITDKEDRAAWTAIIATLAGLLENDDRTVRMAAGEALAVCVELNLTQHTPLRDMEALQAKVSDLVAEASGKGVNRKMLPEQRVLFREIAAFLEHGKIPWRVVSLTPDGFRKLRVFKWVGVVRLNFLRNYLGTGFLKHAQENALFQEAFYVAKVDLEAMFSNMPKKIPLFGKARTIDLHRRRDLAWERKNYLV